MGCTAFAFKYAYYYFRGNSFSCCKREAASRRFF